MKKQISKRHISAKRHKAAIRTNRSLLKRLTMHPTFVFGLLVVGVLLSGLTYHVAASQYSVNATIAAPALQSGATITNPQADQVFTTQTITVSGTCPDSSYVKLLRNGTFSGVAICNNGVFEIKTDLFTGQNDLQAQAYSITDQAGPQTAKILVTYSYDDAAQNTASATTPSAQFAPAAETQSAATADLPLLLVSDYHFNVTKTFNLFAWDLRYQYGTAPYKTHVEWGDGRSADLTVPNDQEFKISNRYHKSGYYPVVVHGTDAKGLTATLQLVVLVKNPGEVINPGIILPPPKTPAPSLFSGKVHWLVYAWPTYGVVGTMATSFWLGEHRELIELTKKAAHAGRGLHRL